MSKNYQTIGTPTSSTGEDNSAANVEVGNTESHPTNSSNLTNNFAFDEFFRKSAVLGPTSSPATNSATRNTVDPAGYLSSPLGSKIVNNLPVNKENANANEYKLI